MTRSPALSAACSRSPSLGLLRGNVCSDYGKRLPMQGSMLGGISTELDPRNDISAVFGGELPKKSDVVVVQRPSHPPSETATLLKQLCDVFDSSFKKWTHHMAREEGRMQLVYHGGKGDSGHLKKVLFQDFPQYDHDDYVEIFVYHNGFPKPEEAIRIDEDLRKILTIAKAQSRKQLTIALEIPTKKFSAWTFKDVISEYNLSESTDVGVEVLPPFTDIQAAPLDSDFQKKIQDQLINEVESRVGVLKLVGANEATKSMVVASFMVAATRLFDEDLYYASQRNLSGRRGNGPVDFSVHSRKTHSYTLGVTEVRKDDFRQGVAQNIVQLESALTAKKRKRETYETDEEEEPPTKMRSYGIVTGASQWLFIECTLHEVDTVSYRMTELERTLDYDGKWQDDAKFVFERLVWLWSRLRDLRCRHAKATQEK